MAAAMSSTQVNAASQLCYYVNCACHAIGAYRHSTNVSSSSNSETSSDSSDATVGSNSSGTQPTFPPFQYFLFDPNFSQLDLRATAEEDAMGSGMPLPSVDIAAAFNLSPFVEYDPSKETTASTLDRLLPQLSNQPEVCYDDDVFHQTTREILQHLLTHQERFHPLNCLSKQTQKKVNSTERGINVAKVMRPAVERFKLSRETLHLAVNIMDRFLASTVITINCLQLLAIVCLHIASKKEDTLVPKVSDLINFVDGREVYLNSQFINLELLILTNLKCQLEVPSAYAVMNCLRELYLETLEFKLNATEHKLFVDECDEICDAVLADYSFMQLPPVIRAAACLHRGLSNVFYDTDNLFLRWVHQNTGVAIDELVKSTELLAIVYPPPRRPQNFWPVNNNNNGYPNAAATYLPFGYTHTGFTHFQGFYIKYAQPQSLGGSSASSSEDSSASTSTGSTGVMGALGPWQ